MPSICRKPITDGTHNSPTTTDKGDFLYITAKNIKFNKIDLSNVSYVSKEIHDEIYKRCPPELNDILLTKDGTIGEVAINNLVEPFSLLSSVALIKPITNILPCFIAYVLMSNYMQSSMKHSAKGVALKRIILEQINTFLIPLPPLTEQKLIVEEIEKIFAQIDLLEQNKTDLQTAIKQAKSKILDLAIHGKLVPQDPNDEPASVLLEKIRAEKEEKIAKGDLKRDKNDSYIYKSTTDNCHYQKNADGSIVNIEDEIPFEVPDGWSWCRFSEATKNRDSERKPVNSSNRKDIKKIYDYYGATGVIDKVEEYLFDEKLLLIGEDGANLLSHTKNNAFIAEGKYWVNNHAHVIDCFDKLMLDYICHYINSLLLDEYITGSAQPKLTQKALNDLLLPLPPLSEQKRIVAKIEELFALLDNIQNNIS